MKPNSQLTLTASALLYIAISCTADGLAAVGPSPASAGPAVLPPEPAPESVLVLKDCEQDVLGLLGWQQMYDPAGYTIQAVLPLNCSTETWQAMGCLKSLVNLTLTGHLPDLPDSWAGNGSFPVLQTMNFSSSSVAGSLPSIWAVDTAFPKLRVLNLSSTQLFGTLPTEWGQSHAFPKLVKLDLGGVNVTQVGDHCCSYKTCTMSKVSHIMCHSPGLLPTTICNTWCACRYLAPYLGRSPGILFLIHPGAVEHTPQWTLAAILGQQRLVCCHAPA